MDKWIENQIQSLSSGFLKPNPPDQVMKIFKKETSMQETEKVQEKKAELNITNCPECGTPLVFQSGCKYCPNCGWEACG